MLGNDLLRGGLGADLLDGGMARDTLWGGADADVFHFAQPSITRIGDFEDGVDRLRIQAVPTVSYEDLAITSFGMSDQHTRITWENIVIELLNLDQALIDAGDINLLLA